MKNATKHQKQIKKFLSGINKSAAPPEADADNIRTLIDAILAADAPKLSAKAMESIEKEFVDFNELRVAPIKEIVDTIGRDFPDVRRKAEEISNVLNAIFNRCNRISLEHAEKLSKRELRRHLAELGLSPYPAGILMLQVFGGHAVPVDKGLVDCLEADELIEPDSGVEEVQSFLERVVLQKHAWGAHEFFREYVIKNAKMLAKKRKSDLAKAEAKAAAADAKAEAEALAEVQAEMGRQAKSKPKQAAPAKKVTPTPAKKRKATKRAAAKTASKGAAKSARKPKATTKAARKPRRKASKKPLTKGVRKTSKKKTAKAPARARKRKSS